MESSAPSAGSAESLANRITPCLFRPLPPPAGGGAGGPAGGATEMVGRLLKTLLAVGGVAPGAAACGRGAGGVALATRGGGGAAATRRGGAGRGAAAVRAWGSSVRVAVADVLTVTP